MGVKIQKFDIDQSSHMCNETFNFVSGANCFLEASFTQSF